jgi:hypothetical protein
MVKRKTIVYITAFAIIFSLSTGYYVYSKIKSILFPTFATTMALNWDIRIPVPEHKVKVASNTGGFPINGSVFYIFEYDNVKDLENSLVWKDKSQSVQNMVATFFEDTGFRKDNINAVINSKKSYKYFYKAKADGSYIILILMDNVLYIIQTIM